MEARMGNDLDPVRLLRLEIQDFRGIDHLVLDFPDDDPVMERAGALVLAGDNGAGKTSVLEAILLAFGRVDLLPSDTASPAELTRQGASDFLIRCVAKHRGDPSPWEINGESVRMLLTSLASTDPLSAYGSPLVSDSAKLMVRVFQGRSRIPWPRIEYFPAGVGLTRALALAPGREASRTTGSGIADIQRRLINAHGRRGGAELFARMNDFLRPFLGARWQADVVYDAEAMDSERRVVLRDGELPEAGISLEAVRARAAQGKAMPRVVPVDRLSAGQKMLIATAAMFLLGDRPPDMVLFDEPEQHLHVTWQRSLVEGLRTLSPKTQFVMATHSPWVLDAVSHSERCELRVTDGPWSTQDAAE